MTTPVQGGLTVQLQSSAMTWSAAVVNVRCWQVRTDGVYFPSNPRRRHDNDWVRQISHF